MLASMKEVPMSLPYKQTLDRSCDSRDFLLVFGMISIGVLAFAAVEIIIAMATGATLAEAVVWATLSIIL